MPHLVDDAMQLWRGPNAMQLIEYNRLTRGAEVTQERVVFGKVNLALARGRGMLLRKNILLREQNQNPIRTYSLRDRPGEAFKEFA